MAIVWDVQGVRAFPPPPPPMGIMVNNAVVIFLVAISTSISIQIRCSYKNKAKSLAPRKQQPTDRRMDQRTKGPTDRWMDRQSGL